MSPENAHKASEHGAPESLLRAIAVCDLVDSTALIEQLGDRKGAAFMQQLDRVARDLLQRHHGREIDKTDGFLLLFERPIQAVVFAIEYQRMLRRLGEAEFLPLKARIAIHVGDVLVWENSSADIARGAKPVEVEGLAKPIAARLMQLALPGQILMTGVAQALVARSKSEMDGEHDLVWKEHGRYRLKGVPEAVVVFEVGERDIAPLATPSQNAKAYRDVPWWRRRTTVAIEILVLIGLVAVAAYFSIRSTDAIAFGKRDWVVVGDLSNKTSEPVFNDSLQTAFRIGLEQSPYVNVISDLDVRHTLALMQRDPDKDHVDRAIGSEIAIRTGARALILPSVMEIGGRVRVTLEVVNPRTQSTVYAESAEGVGLGSALPSFDQVSHSLRLRLGEALSSVEANKAPLPQVTTSNLDALRAYALALDAYAHANRRDALELFKHAVKLDPDFALAYMGLARVYLGASDDVQGHMYMEKAVALRNRLPARDQLYVDAWMAAFESPRAMLEKWHLLGTMYPDYYAAHYNYALYAWESENRVSDAIAAIQPALSEHDPMRGSAYYVLAELQAAQEQYASAAENFKKADDYGDHDQGVVRLDVLAAQRKFAEAEAILANMKPISLASEDALLDGPRIAMLLDQQHWDEAQRVARAAMQSAAKLGRSYQRLFAGISLGIEEFRAGKEQMREAAVAFINEYRILPADNEPGLEDAAFHLLFGAYLSARAGDTDLADRVASDVAARLLGKGFNNIDHMIAIVRAEIARARDLPDEAVKLLEPTLDGRELCLTHGALADAYLQAGESDRAAREFRWLYDHRGRAYLEESSYQLLQPRNVIASNLAALSLGEIAQAAGRDDQARERLTEVEHIFPGSEVPASIKNRIEALRAILMKPTQG